MENTLTATIREQLAELTPALVPLADRLELAAAYGIPVLLTGETGTGKTFLARLIHAHSARRTERLLVVPCGALAPTLMESEFFGHARGAFTGADRAKVGKFEAVGNGTLLLDEIDALGLEQQAMLLRVVETGEFEPVGSNQTRVCQGRVITASNWNLEDAVRTGKFRQDLYYRLNGLAFFLPPLRERPQDIERLAAAFAVRFGEKFHHTPLRISAAALGRLRAYRWPGNIRQLENAIQHAALVCRGSEILPQNLPDALRTETAAPVEPKSPTGTLQDSRLAAERTVIERALAASSNNRARTAHALGISRVTLYKKMKVLGLTGRGLERTAPDAIAPTWPKIRF
jgi:DNA-binding NtrC family response regulator